MDVCIAVNSIINIVIHTFGLFLLTTIKIKRSTKAINHMYLVNLSASELLRNVSYTVYSVLTITSMFGMIAIRDVEIYVLYMLLPVSHSLCYIAILVLAGDRIFLALHGSHVYVSSSWDRSPGKSLLFLLWGVLVVLSVVMYEVVGIFHHMINTIAMSVVTLINVLCVLVVISMYISVHHILSKTRSKFREALKRYPDFENKNLSNNNAYSFLAAVRSVQYYFLTQVAGPHGKIDNNPKQKTYRRTLKQSPFYTTVLLMSSFLILVVVPSLILSACSLVKGFVQEDLLLLVHISTTVSDT